MRSMKVFISGRVTGLPRAEAVRNFERGKKICMLNGFNFVSPTDVVDENATPREAMRMLIPMLLKCDAILMLNDYRFSEGAQLELAIVKYINTIHKETVMRIFFEEDLN